MNESEVIAELRREVERLSSRLDEAEQTISAIRTGAVDALLISGPDGDNVFSLTGSDHNYRILVESIGEGALTATSDGIILYANNKFAEMIGYGGDRIIGRRIGDFVRAEERAAFATLLLLGAEHSCKQEVTLLTAGAGILSTQISIGPLDVEGASGVSIIVTDLTETKVALTLAKANEALVENEARFRSLANSLPQLGWVTDAAGAITWYNQRWYDYTGTTFEEAGGERWASVQHPDHVQHVVDFVKTALKRGEPWELTFPLRGRSGEYRWFLTRAVPVRDSNGKLLHWFGTNTDIQDQRHTLEELSRSNAELARFAFVASHDLKEPLRVVSNYVQMLELRYKSQLDETAAQYMQYIVDAVKRMYALINDLLSYSAIGANAREFAAVDCDEVVRDVISNLRTSLEECGGEILYEKLPTVRGDRAQFLQLFQNLLGNAIKYRSPLPPKIEISARAERGSWIFSVKDNGLGIEPQFFDKVFVLFQRLHRKDEYSGTGIGLAVCKKVVERHGGKIWIQSHLHEGATFLFSIPDVRHKDEVTGNGPPK